MVFINDILVSAEDKKLHAKHFIIVLKTLREHQLYAKLPKRKSWLDEVTLFGHVVSKEGAEVDPQKIKAIKE